MYQRLDSFQLKPVSVSHALADYYLADARDFAARFDRLWETESHKTGRIKTFVDLLMGCECALKAHVFLCQLEEDPKTVYLRLRKAGHRIGTLADQAELLPDRGVYEHLKRELDALSVAVRYSLDAYETFFPSYADRGEAAINYGATIGNHPWVIEVRRCLGDLIDPASRVLGGVVDMDLEVLLIHEKEIQEFWVAVQKMYNFNYKGFPICQALDRIAP